MMWWSGDGSWGHGSWWPALIVMAVLMIVCMMMTARMMSHGGSRSHPARPRHPRPYVPERTLANRLASGEIDIDAYERLLDALQRTADSTRA